MSLYKIIGHSEQEISLHLQTGGGAWAIWCVCKPSLNTRPFGVYVNLYSLNTRPFGVYVNLRSLNTRPFGVHVNLVSNTRFSKN